MKYHYVDGTPFARYETTEAAMDAAVKTGVAIWELSSRTCIWWKEGHYGEIRPIADTPTSRRNKFHEHMELTDATHWATKDGRRIAVVDMDLSHVVSTLAMLAKWAQRSMLADLLRQVVRMPRIDYELMGDGARAALEDELSYVPTVDEYLREHCPPYLALLAAKAHEERIEKERLDKVERDFHDSESLGR